MLWWELRRLRSRDPLRRARAASRLHKWPSPEVIALLVEMLRWGTEAECEAAADTLVRMGGPDVQAALLPELKRTHGRWSAWILDRIGYVPDSDPAKAEFFVILQDWTRAEAIGLAAIVPLSSSTDGGAQDAAARLIGREIAKVFRDRAAMDQLCGLPNLKVETVIRAIEKIEPATVRGEVWSRVAIATWADKKTESELGKVAVERGTLAGPCNQEVELSPF